MHARRLVVIQTPRCACRYHPSPHTCRQPRALASSPPVCRRPCAGPSTSLLAAVPPALCPRRRDSRTTAPHALRAPSWPRTWGLAEARPRPPGDGSLCVPLPTQATQRCEQPTAGPGASPSAQRPRAGLRTVPPATAPVLAPTCGCTLGDAQRAGQGAWQGSAHGLRRRARLLPGAGVARGRESCGRGQSRRPGRFPRGGRAGGPGACRVRRARRARQHRQVRAGHHAPRVPWRAPQRPTWPGRRTGRAGPVRTHSQWARCLAGARLLHSQPGAGTAWSA